MTEKPDTVLLNNIKKYYKQTLLEQFPVTKMTLRNELY